MKTVVSEGVREIWLSSEDTGAYGNLDPPFILEHLKEIAAVLCHPPFTLSSMFLCNLEVILF